MKASPASLLPLVLAALAAGSGRTVAGPAPEPGPRHWSLRPLVRPAVPPGGGNPIDAFVDACLRERGIRPSGEADRRTLLRRLSHDLTGLPPTPEEVEAFVADPDPAAYDRAVDRLLASPRHGEHWARHWLDVANYADTHGNDHDYARPNAWPYRDHVVRAFNDDMPYRRFVLEQVAGDVLFPDDPQATVALGFLAAGPWDHTLMVTVRADTVDHLGAQNLDRDNMVGTAVGTFQSLTIHCARCHDHKFDPISQREYYSLQAVFAGVDRADRTFDDDPAVHRERRRLDAERRSIESRDPALLASLGSPAVARVVAAWEQAWARREAAWEPLDVVGVVSTGGATLARQDDGSWFAGGKRPDRDTYIVTARRRAGRLAAVRLETLPDDRLPQRGPGRWDNGNFHLTEFKMFAATNGSRAGATTVAFARATADHDEGPAISAAQAIDGRDDTQWGVHPRYGEAHEAVFEVREPREWPDGTTFTFLLENQAGAPGHGIGRFRLAASGELPGTARLKPVPTALASILRVAPEKRTAEQRRDLALAVLKERNDEALAALPAPRKVYAVTRDFVPDGDNFRPTARPRPIHVLARGDLAKPREPVGPGTLGCVPGMTAVLAVSDEEDESARRAALARWLADDANVLTWRSIVNRAWAWHFGRGLCDTPNDFGRMGGTPSHPELLDWLATWFRDDAHGSLKALHRLIVTSDAWRRASSGEQGAATDPDNRLLWRHDRTRLSAEEIRDTLLFLGGRLDLAMGGPAAVQFLEKGDATFMPGGNPAFVDYGNLDPDAPAARRRAIYRFLFRTVPDPFMDALDCPDGGVAAPVRGVSTTAVQAFAMLNDPFVIRHCGHIAERVALAGNDAGTQADAAFRRILQRRATPAERDRLAGYIRRHGLANACQVLVNGNEFVHLD